MKELGQYFTSWHGFRDKCEEKVKGRCHINNKGWAKLRDYHMGQWLGDHQNPFGFMFKLKHQHDGVYQRIPCAPKWYHIARADRESRFETSIANKFVTFPSWKNSLKVDKADKV